MEPVTLHATRGRGTGYVSRSIMNPQGLGFALGRSRIHTTTRPNKARAIFRARKALEEIVYDTVALEGNPFTFPEVKTLMEGITVGGRRTEDAEQVLNAVHGRMLARSEREVRSALSRGRPRMLSAPRGPMPGTPGFAR